MKRVLIFSLAYFPHVGGAEVSVKEITDRNQDIEFHMVTNRFDSALPKVEKVGNVLVHRIGITANNPTMADLRKFPLHLNKIFFQFLAALKAIRLQRAYRYDSVWAVMAHSCGVPAVLFKMVYPGIPLILNLQEGDPLPYIERKMRPLWPLFSRVFAKADIVQPLSQYLADWARKRGFRGPIEIIPNAVDVKRFSQNFPEMTINEIRDRLGKKMGDVFVITTSRLVKKNAVDDVISALPKLPSHVHFVVLGIGPDEQILRGLAKKLNVENRVHFLGHIRHAEMPKYLKACDIFIRASRSEAFGASFVEAMAAGLPVIATQEGGIADFLFDEKANPDKPITGWAVKKDSPDQIVVAIQDIMSRPEKVRAVVTTAKKMVEEKYDWDVVARDMRKKVFDRVML